MIIEHPFSPETYYVKFYMCTWLCIPRKSKCQTWFQVVQWILYMIRHPTKEQNNIPFCFLIYCTCFYPPRKLKYTIGAFAFAIQDPQAPLPGYHGTDSPKAGVIYHFQLSIDPVLIVCDAPEEAWLSGFVVVYFALKISSKNGWCCQLPVQ